MIVARLTPKVSESEDKSFEIINNIRDIIKKEEISGYKFYLNGGAAITTSFVYIAIKDGSTFMPLAIFFVVLFYLLFLKELVVQLFLF